MVIISYVIDVRYLLKYYTSKITRDISVYNLTNMFQFSDKIRMSMNTHILVIYLFSCSSYNPISIWCSNTKDAKTERANKY